MAARRRLAPVPLLLAVVGAGSVALAATAVGGETAAAPLEQTITVKRGVVQTTVSGSGSLSPSTTRELSFGASGTVTKVYVKVGEHVSAGQLLARLDPAASKVELAQANSTLATAEDALVNAQIAGVTGSWLTAAEAAVASAELGAGQAEDALDATVLRAPDAGTVAALGGAVGDTVGTGTTAASTGSEGASAGTGAAAASTTDSSATGFVTLVQLSRYTMEVSLSEADITKVKVGQRATVTVNAAADGEFAARVAAVPVLSSSSSAAGSGRQRGQLPGDDQAGPVRLQAEGGDERHGGGHRQAVRRAWRSRRRRSRAAASRSSTRRQADHPAGRDQAWSATRRRRS